MSVILGRYKGQVQDGDALSAGEKQRNSATRDASDALLARLEWQFQRHAERWGIRPHQARALLMDRKAVPA